MRLLSAEARIPLNHIRNGKMSTEEWDRLARHVAKVSAAPMFIDDSPNMTMMEIRAKARRLKQRHDLKVVVIDYLQLMSSGKKVESRQLEVSEFSRRSSSSPRSSRSRSSRSPSSTVVPSSVPTSAR